MKEIHVVGAAIIRDGKVLAARRSAKMNEALKWEFAGGKVESGETHREALKREIFEELELDIEVGEHVADGFSVIGDKNIILHVYKARIVSGEPVPREHSELKWVDIRELQGLDWAKADQPAVGVLTGKA